VPWHTIKSILNARHFLSLCLNARRSSLYFRFLKRYLLIVSAIFTQTNWGNNHSFYTISNLSCEKDHICRALISSAVTWLLRPIHSRPLHLRPRSFETCSFATTFTWDFFIWDDLHLRPQKIETTFIEITFIWDHIHLRPQSIETTFNWDTIIWDYTHLRSHSFYAMWKWSCFDLLCVTFYDLPFTSLLETWSFAR